ncbi:MAG: hypothetical protein ACE5GK_09550 [Nitrospiria bacterium]
MKKVIQKRSLFVLFFSSILFLEAFPAKATMEIEVHLQEFSVDTSSQTATPGSIRFVAKNRGTEEHELVVRRKAGEHFQEFGEIEAIAPGTGKLMTVHLPPGQYELSCQIVETEDGETVDHYKKGMHVEIAVE